MINSMVQNCSFDRETQINFAILTVLNLTFLRLINWVARKIVPAKQFIYSHKIKPTSRWGMQKGC